MTHLPVDRRLVDEALRKMLDSKARAMAGGFPVGLSELPAGLDPGEPGKFAILIPVTGVGEGFIGPSFAHESDATLAYDLRSCGKDWRQTQAVADRLRLILFEREPWGAPVNLIEIEGHEENDRSAAGGLGSPTLIARQWQCTDSFTVTVARRSAA